MNTNDVLYITAGNTWPWAVVYQNDDGTLLDLSYSTIALDIDGAATPQRFAAITEPTKGTGAFDLSDIPVGKYLSTLTLTNAQGQTLSSYAFIIQAMQRRGQAA